MCAAFVRFCNCRVCSLDVSLLFSQKGLKEDFPGCLGQLLLVAVENDDSLLLYVCRNCLATAQSIESKLQR